MPYGKTPYRRRSYRRTYKPKARTRVDKAQNKRINKLEKAKEVKFITGHQETISNTNDIDLDTTTTVPTVKQSIDLMPVIYTGSGKSGRIGEEINVRSINLKIRMNPLNQVNQRFILVMDNRPTYQGLDGTGNLDRLQNPLSWDSLLEHYGGKGITDVRHIISPINVANHTARRFSVLMDKTIKKTTNGGEPVEFSFNRSYKSLRFKYEDGTNPLQSLYSINKRLRLFYVSTEPAGGTNPQFSYSVMLRWTDS